MNKYTVKLYTHDELPGSTIVEFNDSVNYQEYEGFINTFKYSLDKSEIKYFSIEVDNFTSNTRLLIPNTSASKIKSIFLKYNEEYKINFVDGLWFTSMDDLGF